MKKLIYILIAIAVLLSIFNATKLDFDELLREKKEIGTC